jgi:glucans biosynthesis protein C
MAVACPGELLLPVPKVRRPLYQRAEMFSVQSGIGLLVLFRQRLNHQGRLARNLAATVYIVYLIHAPIMVGFAYAFHVVALYPLLKWAIAVLITIPLCYLIRKIPYINRVL